MGRAPCCDKANVKKGPWSPEEDVKLKEYIEKYGTEGNWISLPQKAGLKRCGKSCRLRWLNYLRPNIKHGEFSDEEDGIICKLFATIGSRWSVIAAQLPGRTDNDIKNYWNTKLKKKLYGRPQKDKQTNNRIASRKSQANSGVLPNPSSFPESIKKETSILCFENQNYSSLFMNSHHQQQHDTQNDQFSGLETSPSDITHLNYIWPGSLSLNADQCEPFSNCAFGGDHQSCTTSDGSYQYQAAGMKTNDMIPSELILDTMNFESLLFPPKVTDSQNSFRVVNEGNNHVGFDQLGETGMWGSSSMNMISDIYGESKPFSGQDQFNNFFLGAALSSSNLSQCFSQDRLMY